MKHIFSIPKYLLPLREFHNNWPVIACDQYTSNPSYWFKTYDKLDKSVSSVNLIIPEAIYPNINDWKSHLNNLEQISEYYIRNGYFEELNEGVIVVKRITNSGERLGVLLLMDLEDYDYKKESKSLIKASEFTDFSRLIKRKELRESSSIELSHTLLFFDDLSDGLLREYRNKINFNETLYDVTLDNEAGSLSAFLLKDENYVLNYFDNLIKSNRSTFFVGDGNHSLASAKVLWDEIKVNLSIETQKSHPLRFHLVELININDAAVVFHPIHRIVYPIDEVFFRSFIGKKIGNKELVVYYNKKKYSLFVGDDVIDNYIYIDELLIEYAKNNNLYYDFIHDEENAKNLNYENKDCVVIIMPTIDKNEFFKTLDKHKILPKKSFSVGYANEKRYYFEARYLK